MSNPTVNADLEDLKGNTINFITIHLINQMDSFYAINKLLKFIPEEINFIFLYLLKKLNS
jgi:hypothetical protein